MMYYAQEKIVPKNICMLIVRRITMTNIDKSKAVRALVVFLFGVGVIAFGFNLFGDTTESTSALLYPLTVFGVYIPLAFAVVGVLLGLAAYLLEGTLKKRLRVSTCIFLAVALSVSLGTFWVGGVSTASDDTAQKRAKAEEKYQIENFFPNENLVLSTEYDSSEPFDYALGDYFAYHAYRSYETEQEDSVLVDFTVMEWQNIPWYAKRAVWHKLEDFYFQNPTDTGTIGQNQYIYILEEEPGYREKDKAHLFVLMRSENTYMYAEIHVYYQGVNPLSVSQVLNALAE